MEENITNNRINTDTSNLSQEQDITQPKADLGVVEPIKEELEPAISSDNQETFIDEHGIKRNKKDGTIAKGCSGNPLGKPVGTESFKTIFEKALKRLADVNNKKPDELYEEIVSNALKSARSGDYRFYKDLLDRIYGKPKESMDITSGGEKVRGMFEVNIINGSKQNGDRENQS